MDRQTDAKRCIGAHGAICTAVLNYEIEPVVLGRVGPWLLVAFPECRNRRWSGVSNHTWEWYNRAIEIFYWWRVLQCSEMTPGERKNWLLSFFFFLRHINMRQDSPPPNRYIFTVTNIWKISNEKKIDLWFYFFRSLTRQKSSCRDSSSVEYNFCGLMNNLFIHSMHTCQLSLKKWTIEVGKVKYPAIIKSCSNIQILNHPILLMLLLYILFLSVISLATWDPLFGCIGPFLLMFSTSLDFLIESNALTWEP